MLSEVTEVYKITIMGILRFYLALCVVSAHSHGAIFPWLNHNSREAVQIFYLISGFYMAHIASKYNSCIEFYLSRFIRIYTPYYFILFVIIIISYISGYLFNYWGMLRYFNWQLDSNGYAGIALASISNITVFFQDWIMFIKDDIGGGVSFTTDFSASKNPLFNYLLIPQAWSVGVELTFYMFVPFLNKLKSITLCLVIIASVMMRVVAYEYLHLTNDPWTYRFFPFEVAIFVLGMLSNRFYFKIKKFGRFFFIPASRVVFQYFLGILLTILLIILLKKVALTATLYVGSSYAELLSYVLWAMAIPMLFLFFEKIPYDRYIGELSYPIYLIHLSVIIYLKSLMDKFGIDIGYFGIVSSFVTIFFAVILYEYLIIPVDKVRYGMARDFSNYKLYLSKKLFRCR